MKLERLQLPYMPSNGALGMSFVKIVGPEFVIGAAIAHDVVDAFEELMAHRDNGFLVAAMPYDAVVPGLERRPVAAWGGQTGLDQVPRSSGSLDVSSDCAVWPALSLCPGHIAPHPTRRLADLSISENGVGRKCGSA